MMSCKRKRRLDLGLLAACNSPWGDQLSPRSALEAVRELAAASSIYLCPHPTDRETEERER